jgi:hypothetical protein
MDAGGLVPLGSAHCGRHHEINKPQAALIVEIFPLSWSRHETRVWEGGRSRAEFTSRTRRVISSSPETPANCGQIDPPRRQTPHM